MNYCVCGDQSPPGWRYCIRCHAWDDLHVALRHIEIGVDTYRLKRALDVLRGPGHRRVTVDALIRRIATLEMQMESLT